MHTEYQRLSNIISLWQSNSKRSYTIIDAVRIGKSWPMSTFYYKKSEFICQDMPNPIVTVSKFGLQSGYFTSTGFNINNLSERVFDCLGHNPWFEFYVQIAKFIDRSSSRDSITTCLVYYVTELRRFRLWVPDVSSQPLFPQETQIPWRDLILVCQISILILQPALLWRFQRRWIEFPPVLNKTPARTYLRVMPCSNHLPASVYKFCSLREFKLDDT